MVLAEPDVDWVFGEVGSITAEESRLGVQGAAGEDPAGVSPPGTVVRCMWVAFLVGVLMVNAVSGYPEDRATFERETAAHGDEVFDPLGNFITAMGQQAVIRHADADVDREEVHDQEDGKIFPREEEERSDGSDVEETHGDGGDPVDAAFLIFAAHAQILLDLLGHFGDCWNNCGQLGRFDRGCFDGAERSHI